MDRLPRDQSSCWIPVAPGAPSDISKSTEIWLTKSTLISAAYEIRTKSAKSRGSEKDGRRERILALGRGVAVQRFAREGPCLLGIFAGPQPGRECLARCDWRRTQSPSNPSPAPNSLLTREINREFRKIQASRGDFRAFSGSKFNALQGNSLADLLQFARVDVR